MIRNLLLLIAVASVLIAPGARAEKASMSPEELLDTATHVITGRVKAVYARTETDDNWRTTHYVAEVRIEKSEKGDGLKAGDLTYVRYWTRGWVGKGDPPPSTGGHRGLPEAGQDVRIYLARNAYDGFGDDNNDGGYNVIGANGFEKL